MAVLAQLSDLHLAQGDPQGARARLDQAVAALGRVAPRPDALLLSGDLVDDGLPASYAQVKEALAPLGDLSVHVLPGNHDDRQALREAFGLLGEDGSRVRGTARVGELALVLCDSTLPGRPDGALPAEELAWLDAALSEEPDRPTLVALHHPPVATGLAFMDALGLPPDEQEAFARVVAAHPQVQLVTSGHVHVAMTARVGGHPLLTAPSTAGALALDLRPEARTAFATTQPHPGFVVHQLAGGVLRSHVQQALPGDDRVHMTEAHAEEVLALADGGADRRPAHTGEPDPEVRDVPDRDRYELRLGELFAGLVAYRRRPGLIALTHTEVPDALEGRGLASVLVRGVLDDLRGGGEAVLPFCPYVSAWIGRHPEYADLVPEAERERFGL